MCTFLHVRGTIRRPSARAGNPAEAAFVVFLAVNHVFVPARALGRRIVPRTCRNVHIVQLIKDNADPRSCRIGSAESRASVERGAGHFTGATTDTLVKVDLDLLDDLLGRFVRLLLRLFITHGSVSPSQRGLHPRNPGRTPPKCLSLECLPGSSL